MAASLGEHLGGGWQPGPRCFPRGAWPAPSPPAPALGDSRSRLFAPAAPSPRCRYCPSRRERVPGGGGGTGHPPRHRRRGGQRGHLEQMGSLICIISRFSSELLEGGGFHRKRRGGQGPEVITQNNEFSSRSLWAERVPVRGCTHPAPPPSRNPQISKKTWGRFKCIPRKLM